MENFESTPKPDGAPKCTNYYTPELVSKAIAELTAESARTAIEKRGHFAMGLAGGSLIKMLSGLKDEKNNIEWDKVNEILWFVYDLEGQAKEKGGRVHYLLGNHEYMVLYNDLRYIHD